MDNTEYRNRQYGESRNRQYRLLTYLLFLNTSLSRASKPVLPTIHILDKYPLCLIASSISNFTETDKLASQAIPILVYTMLNISPAHAKYLATTDFNLMLNCLQWKLNPDCYRILHYINSCLAHGFEELNLGEAVKWLEIDVITLYGDIQYLIGMGIISGIEIEYPTEEAA